MQGDKINDKQMTLVEGNDEKGIISSKGRKVKRILKEYEVDKGERGVYNSKNRLNDLTGREWTFFINSVQITDYSRSLTPTKILAHLVFHTCSTSVET